jgi:transcriptional regulator with XRE-family HTH domain
MAEKIKVIARRLVMTREAIGLSQAEFCEQIGVARNIYNPFEKGKRRITLDVALRIRHRFAVPLDWVYCGDPSHLPVEIFQKLPMAA